MPRQGRFFGLFDTHASLILDGANALADVFRHYENGGDRDAGLSSSKTPSMRRTAITHETMELLHATFITPFDRDDIHRLISRMDDVLDLIQDTGESLVLYDIQKVTPEATELAELVQRCGERVQSAVTLLASMTDAPAMLEDLPGDRQARIGRRPRDARGLSKLFRDETDVRQVIKLKAVYESLESATDKCQDVANVIESVVLENA